MTDLTTMTNAQLVERYNAIPGVKPLKAWKGKKEVLIQRIKDAAPAESADGAKGKAAQAKKAKEPRKRKAGEVRKLCERLLQEVAYYEDRTRPPGEDNVVEADDENARSVGLPFSEILRRVQKEMPGVNTTYACLRWYAVHMRRAGVKLPGRRPKSSWK